MKQIQDLLVSILVIRNPCIPKRTFMKFLTTSTKESSTSGGCGRSDVLFHLETLFKIEVAEKLRRFFNVITYLLVQLLHESNNY